MIAIVDYGMGNLRSVSKALEHVGAEVCLTADPDVISRAAKVVLPGVGAFPAAMHELARRGLVQPILEAIAQGKPYLGICLGLQLLFERSEEGYGAKGLGVLPGIVRRFADTGSLKIPHMGWNRVAAPSAPRLGPAGHGRCPLLRDIPDGSFYYFVHSYYADPVDWELVALEADYGGPFAAMVWRRQLYATQFHPEKSQALGLQLLQNFVRL